MSKGFLTDKRPSPSANTELSKKPSLHPMVHGAVHCSSAWGSKSFRAFNGVIENLHGGFMASFWEVIWSRSSNGACYLTECCSDAAGAGAGKFLPHMR